MPILTISSLEKSFPGPDGPVPVLRGVDLTITPRESCAIMGESGSGKSTLLHIAAGLEWFEVGRVAIDGQEIGGMADRDLSRLRRRDIAIVFQHFNLIPSLTVAQNMAFQARLAGRHDPALLDVLAHRLGLERHVSKYPEDLSGGQQQRVAIARALATRPKIIFADEPTGNLDETTADLVLTLLLENCRDQGAGLLMATHSERLALRLDRMVRLSQGRLA